MKRRIIAMLTLLGGLIFFLQFVLPSTFELPGVGTTIHVDKIVDDHVSEVLIVMGSFGIGLSVINITMIHGKVVVKKGKGWHNSAALLVAMVVTTVFGLLMTATKPDENGAAGSALYQFSENIYQKIIFKGFFEPLSATVFSLLAFYIAAAAYRSFRARSVEAALLMFVAIIVMIGQVPPMAHWLSGSWPAGYQMTDMKEWLLNVPNNAAQRGFIIGAAVAGLAMSLRIWFSLEKGTFFDQH